MYKPAILTCVSRLMCFACIYAVFFAGVSISFSVEPHVNWQNSLKPRGKAGPMLTLAKNSRTLYRIVVPEEPTTQEEKAATDLAQWLGEMTGGKFGISREPTNLSPQAKVISVGRTKMLAVEEIPEAKKDLGGEGYGVAVKGSNLYLFGGKRRGPIYAVYALLEEDLGCRWYAPTMSTIPHRATLKFRPVPRVYRPVLDLRRDPYYADVWDVDWSLRNKTYQSIAAVPTEWGGSPITAGGSVHTFWGLVPPGQYFAEHPEYFAEVNGKRQKSQLCMTHPEVLRIVKQKVRANLKAYPKARLVDVSTNDTKGYCECVNCMKITDEEGTYMGPLLKFVNAVADSIRDDYPQTMVTTLAYMATTEAPKTFGPRDNVLIVFCNYYANPDKYVWEDERYSAALEGWERWGAEVTVWDYPSHFEYMLPNFNSPVVGPNIRYFIKHGARGYMAQCAHAANYAADHSFQRSWVWTKQMWNPDLDTRALIRDFNFGFYGPAAPRVQEYDDLLWATWQDWHANRPDEDVDKALTPEFVDRIWQLLTEAEKSVAADEELTRRVKLAQLPIMYMKLNRGRRGDAQPYLSMYADFEKTARAAGVRYVQVAWFEPDFEKMLTLWRKLGRVNFEKVSVLQLDEGWKFRMDNEGVGEDQQWYATDFGDSGWLSVQSETQPGFDGQGHYEQIGQPPGWGWYRRRLDVSDEILRQPVVKLYYSSIGVFQEAEVYVNGKKAFAHTAGATGRTAKSLYMEPFAFDARSFLKTGKNSLTVRVRGLIGRLAKRGEGLGKPMFLVIGSEDVPADILETAERQRQAGSVLPSRWDRL